jgi:hypothetical protein
MPLADTSTKPMTAKSRIQSDEALQKIRIAGSKIKLYPNLTAEIQQYYASSRDMAMKTKFDHGFDIYFQNPRKSLTDVLTMMAKIQAYRDRVTEIQIYLVNGQMKLERYIRLTNAHMYEMYASEIKSRGASEQQKYFIMSLIPGMHDKIEIIKAHLKIVEAVLNNLDKAHFAYKGIAEFGSKLIDRMEGGHAVARSA